MKLFGYDINKSATPQPVENVVRQRKKSSRQYHEIKQKYQTREDMLTHRSAIDTANNVENFARYDLHQIYRKVLMDPEHSAQWNTRVLKTIDKEFTINNADGEINNVAVEMFKAPWFHQWIELILEQKLWGFSLIEFGPWNGGENAFEPYLDSTGIYHTAVEAVDRDYVRPEFGMIVPGLYDGRNLGVSYLNSRFSDRLMFVGTAEKEKSILYKSAPYMLLKDNAHKNWSEWAEVFSMGMRIGKTEASGDERKAFENLFRNSGSNQWGVIDVDDMIEFIGPENRQDAYQVYLSFLEYCDARIAKLIFGQDVVTNNTGRVVGKVGDDLSNLYGDSDAKFVEWIINKSLIPYMAASGADVEGLSFKYDTTEKVKLVDRAKIDKAIADMGFRIDEDYIERTYGTNVVEYEGVPYSGREGQEEDE